MFTRLLLRQFKAWRDKIDITLAPVTMLLGTNSSGKSSLLQTLLLLKQTVGSPDRSIHLNLGGDEINDYFNFGHFEDVLTRRANPRQFELGFTFQRGKRSTINVIDKRRVNSGEFFASYGMTSSGAAAIQEMILRSGKTAYRVVRRDKGAYSLFFGEETQSREKADCMLQNVRLPSRQKLFIYFQVKADKLRISVLPFAVNWKVLRILARYAGDQNGIMFGIKPNLETWESMGAMLFRRCSPVPYYVPRMMAWNKLSAMCRCG